MKPTLRVIDSENFPKPLGHYSQAIAHGDLLTVSGQIAVDKQGRSFCEDDIGTQMDCIFANLKNILNGADTSIDQILDVVVFLTSMDDLATFNRYYSKHLGSHKPTRSVVEVTALPKDASVELKVVACLGQ